MVMIIPVSGGDLDEAVAVARDRAERYAVLKLDDNGRQIGLAACTQLGDWIRADGCAVVVHGESRLDDFLEYEIPVLSAPAGATIEEIREGYVFRELYEIA